MYHRAGQTDPARQLSLSLRTAEIHWKEMDSSPTRIGIQNSDYIGVNPTWVRLRGNHNISLDVDDEEAT